MTASYPASAKTYVDKVDGVDYVNAAHMNSVQEEIVAIQSTVGVNPQTSVLGTSNIGTYSITGTNTTVSARLKNLEAGLSGDATNGTRVGYTQLDQKSLTTAYPSTPGTATFSSISGNYRKLVLQISVSSLGASSALTMTINGVSTNYSTTSNVYGTATPSTTTTGTSIPLGSPAGTSYTAVVELPNYSVSGGKNFSVLGTDRSVTGYVATGAVTTLAVTGAAPGSAGGMSVVCTLFGVK